MMYQSSWRVQPVSNLSQPDSASDERLNVARRHTLNGISPSHGFRCAKLLHCAMPMLPFAQPKVHTINTMRATYQNYLRDS